MKPMLLQDKLHAYARLMIDRPIGTLLLLGHVLMALC